MKRIIYTLMIALFSSFAITACTEEPVVPTTDNGGGTPDGMIDIKR